MSAIINKKTTEAVYNRLAKDILEADHNGLEAVIEEFFDGEDELHDASSTMVDTCVGSMMTLLAAAGIKDQTVATTIKKMLIVSTIAGFLCERYSRDILKDLDSVNGSKDIARAYETVEDFLTRLNKSSKKPSLKAIASKETKGAAPTN